MPTEKNDAWRVLDLGSMGYREAFELQRAHLEEVLASREAGQPEIGRLLLVEHDPVITVSRRASAGGHVTATPAMLERAGVVLEQTDRGGDVTYHGPGQLVAYPILDLNRLGLNLHAYMRLLEQTVIDTLGAYGLEGWRDQGATGVWVNEAPGAKIAAMGVRVRRWISMHGLALNVCPEMTHFDLIVPCGLAGRSVTSMQRELGEACPSMEEAKKRLTSALWALVSEKAELIGRAQPPG
jgi:lipoyl(octanoyl) transferase